MLTAAALDRAALLDWYRRNRERSAALFDMIDPAAYYTRPISLRNPIVFYEGHLPAFSVLAFLRRGLGRPHIDARLEQLFERGIDPDSVDAAVPRSGASTVWPSRDEVRRFARLCDQAVLSAIADAAPTPDAIEGLYTALEHEAMHQETLLYMFHRLPYNLKRAEGHWLTATGEGRAGGQEGDAKGQRAAAHEGGSVSVPAGTATLGSDRKQVAFGWDNEFDRHVARVPAFEIDALPVTNAQFLEFIDAGGYDHRELWDEEGWEWIRAQDVTHPAFWLRASDIADRTSVDGWLWRGMFSATPLNATAPVYVSQSEASAYARWKGRRLMTEAEWHRAAEGATAGQSDFVGFDPVPAASHPQTASVHGVHDLIGNGWEWTSTVFGPFGGFAPMRSYPEYSADFFDGRHFVMKGASPVTARELIRPSFRNWFRGNYPYVYAKFRTVSDVR
jgi:ergothioneine biosynthesis protein EgtB